MRQRRQAFGVPLHPLLVHLPIGLWLTAPFLDVAVFYAGPETWWTVALGATGAGLLFGALAIATGLLEYLDPTLAGIDMRLAARHGTQTTLAWCVFAAKMVLAAVLPPVAGWQLATFLALDVLGCALLLQGVIYGTRQVYQQLDAR